MGKLRAPYNFVPLNQKVVFPEWAEQISQDVPFSDAVSGTLELTVTAQSDIFIRNGHTRDDASQKNENYSSFSKTADGRFFIPGTSLKGAVRNVLEILSCGKAQRVVNRSFGIRDLKGGDQPFYTKIIRPNSINCGWLYREDDAYKLIDCGRPWRISAEELDRHFGSSLLSFIREGNFKDDEKRTAQIKYKMFEPLGVLTGTFAGSGKYKNQLKVVQYSDHGTPGTVVFTGQTGGGYKKEVKVYEFVFPDDPISEKTVEVPEQVFREFDSIHQTSSDYMNYWAKKLERGQRIPVFFLYKPNKELDAMGLAFMFKYPAYHSVYDAIPDELLSWKPDLASCIFGYSLKDKSLRGRVQFGHAFAQGTPVERPQCSASMASPKPSFYPFYLGHGNTWNTKGDIQIAGRKRYPVRSKLQPFEVATANMEGQMRPLAEGTVFKGYIHFHNLRKVELGALVSALTFHGHPECAHQLGAAKPFGYGKVRLEVAVKDADRECNLSELMQDFENWMKEQKNDWLQSWELKELFAMAKGIPEGREDEFTYMKMSMRKDENEFENAKKMYKNEGVQLGSFTQILSGNVPTTRLNSSIPADGSFIRKDKEGILNEKYKKEEEEKREEEERKTRERKAEALLAQAIQDAWERENYKEYLIRIQEVKNHSLYDEYEKKLNERIEEYNASVKEQRSEADGLRFSKRYEEALARYREIAEYVAELVEKGLPCSCNVNPEINECQMKIQEMQTLSGQIFADYLESLKFTSLPALGNQLKKWIQQQGDLNDEDCALLADRVQKELQSWKEKDIQKFFSKSNCQKFEKSVGERIAQFVTGVSK